MAGADTAFITGMGHFQGIEKYRGGGMAKWELGSNHMRKICVFTLNYFAIIIILKIAIYSVVLILKSIKIKLIIVNPYFPENNSIYTFVYFVQILLPLLLSSNSYLFCRLQSVAIL